MGCGSHQPVVSELVDFYILVYSHQFHLPCYYSELHGCCGQTERQCLELVCPTMYMKSQVFPGLFLYWYMEVGIPETIEVTRSPCWREFLMVSRVFFFFFFFLFIS